MSEQYSLEDSEAAIILRKSWQDMTQSLRDTLQQSIFERFVQPLEATLAEDDVVQVRAPGKFVAEWVGDKLLPLLEQDLGARMERPIRIRIVAKPIERAPLADQPVAIAPPSVESSQAFVPMERYRFENFVIGHSNRLAYSGARAVAEELGRKYNPLFIYGSPGLGKTHLLHSIAHAVRVNHPGITVAYVTGQRFIEEFLLALQNNQIEQFRRRQRSAGVWLVDDIQLVAGKERTQEEVFHTFNHLYSLGKQIVLCSDRRPRELFLMDERLRSRFESGLVADIKHPDTETRCAILLRMAERDGIAIEHEIAMFLAQNVTSNVRVLEGALIKVAAEASVADSPVTLDIAQHVVETYYRAAGTAKPGHPQILDIVSRQFNIPIDEIKGQSRKAPITHARHVAVYLARELTGDSWKHLGAVFGDRDHTSMMHAYQKISELIITNRDLEATIRRLMRDLQPEL